MSSVPVHAQHAIAFIPLQSPSFGRSEFHRPISDHEAQVIDDLLVALCGPMGRVRRELIYQSERPGNDGPFWYRGFSTVLP